MSLVQVGYGKTAVTVALIDSKRDKPIPVQTNAGKISVKVCVCGNYVLPNVYFSKEFGPSLTRVNRFHICLFLQGTLVLVPPHLMKQWPSEIRKFTGDALHVEVIKTVGDLGRMTIQQVGGTTLSLSSFHSMLLHRLSSCPFCATDKEC